MGPLLESGLGVTCVVLGPGHGGHASPALFAGTLVPSHPARELTAQRLPRTREPRPHRDGMCPCFDPQPTAPCLQTIPVRVLAMRVKKLLEDSTSQMFKSLPNHLCFPS